jgi:hypothetical protein
LVCHTRPTANKYQWKADRLVWRAGITTDWGRLASLWLAAGYWLACGGHWAGFLLAVIWLISGLLVACGRLCAGYFWLLAGYFWLWLAWGTLDTFDSSEFYWERLEINGNHWETSGKDWKSNGNAMRILLIYD